MQNNYKSLFITSGKYFFFMAFICLAVAAHSQVYYQDIAPDTSLTTWSSYDLNIDSPVGAHLTYGAPCNLTIWNDFGTQIDVNAFSNCQVLMTGTLPQALDSGHIISASSATWVQPSYSILCDGHSGNWMGVTDKYLGIRVKNGTNWYYGWIRMNVNMGASTVAVTIKDYARNTQAGASIKAGQKSTTVITPLSSFVNTSFTYSNGKLEFKDLPKDKKISYAVSDITGKRLASSILYNNSIDLVLPKSVYILTLSVDAETRVFKFE